MKRVVIHGEIIQSVFSFMMEETAAAAIIISLVLKNKRERSAKRKKEQNGWLLQRVRPILGAYDALLAELRLAEETDYRLSMFIFEKKTKTTQRTTHIHLICYLFNHLLSLISVSIGLRFHKHSSASNSHINALFCSIFLLLIEDISFLKTNKKPNGHENSQLLRKT